MIDHRDDGTMFRDRHWEALNPQGFKYGRGGANTQFDPNTGVDSDRFPGFLNQYSITGIEEDKAEVFANLMVDDDYIQIRVRTDSVLRKKVELMKLTLAQFCPELDDEFWRSVRMRQTAATQDAGENRGKEKRGH